MRFALLMFLGTIASAAPPAPSPIDITQAQAAFAEAEAVSNKEGGRLWGKKPDRDSARRRAVGKLTDPDQSMTFVRSFAYTSGPAVSCFSRPRLSRNRPMAAGDAISTDSLKMGLLG